MIRSFVWKVFVGAFVLGATGTAAAPQAQVAAEHAPWPAGQAQRFETLSRDLDALEQELDALEAGLAQLRGDLGAEGAAPSPLQVAVEGPRSAELTRVEVSWRGQVIARAESAEFTSREGDTWHLELPTIALDADPAAALQLEWEVKRVDGKQRVSHSWTAADLAQRRASRLTLVVSATLTEAQIR